MTYVTVHRGHRTLLFEDMHCSHCGQVRRNLYFKRSEWPRCCGREMWIAILSPRLTDCYGTPRYSDASGKFHSSRHDLVEHMRREGYTECGDPVGGSRVDLSLRNSAFSYAGQVSRASTDERRRERKRVRDLRNSGRLKTADAGGSNPGSSLR